MRNLDYYEPICEKCENNSSNGLKNCPYKVEINDDRETLCNCCSDCSRQCAEDV